MSLLDEIVILRHGDEVIARVAEQCFKSVLDAASYFGLKPIREAYRQIPREEAIAILDLALREDMAHGYQFMSAEQSLALAIQFVDQFPPHGTAYYTNGEFGKSRDDPQIGPSWHSVTDATFDTGVLVLSLQSTGCLWFKDED